MTTEPTVSAARELLSARGPLHRLDLLTLARLRFDLIDAATPDPAALALLGDPSPFHDLAALESAATADPAAALALRMLDALKPSLRSLTDRLTLASADYSQTLFQALSHELDGDPDNEPATACEQIEEAERELSYLQLVNAPAKMIEAARTRLAAAAAPEPEPEPDQITPPDDEALVRDHHRLSTASVLAGILALIALLILLASVATRGALRPQRTIEPALRIGAQSIRRARLLLSAPGAPSRSLAAAPRAVAPRH
ncbi:hypothetical protein [Agromyces aerolatus]|uniref:hypothetical protein n=1 Tax=Agromyces sp. LY-1074 TaxID=3074080 RepID=UPI002855DEFE|nr:MULTISPECIES: hypothetical protein [unclassified Agromyces]MDR5699853.1 hypothetical protein [Agromyces sp. LY-1074]MDR5706335.1 hypothetical protein [Agromyces sp. LY-1358]